MKKYPAIDGRLFNSKEEKDAHNQWLKVKPIQEDQGSLGMDQLGGGLISVVNQHGGGFDFWCESAWRRL